MWPFGKDRRQVIRRAVRWQALFHCTFSNFQAALKTRVVNISLGGAVLHLERLQIGPYHLAISDQPPQLELEILLPEGALKANVEIRWYDWLEDQRIFAVGVEFIDLSEKSQETLLQAINDLPGQ